jgi:MarR family transcriptional regulator for hemolysin
MSAQETVPAETPNYVMSFLLHDVARMLRKRFEQHARAKKLGLTRSQASVLARLAQQEGINQVTLAQLLELEPITLVRLLDRLQAAGLIERRADPQDRRARVLFLTARARPLLERVQVLGAEVREEAMAGLTAGEREMLVNMLVTMKSNLIERLADQPGAEPLAALMMGELVDG